MSDRDNSVSTPAARDDYRYAKLALAWHGWGSPVGLGLFLLALSLSAALFRRAFFSG